jgi:hypothetical protein
MDDWKYPYRPQWLGSEWEADIFERHVFWNPDTQKWAIRASDSDVLTHFVDRQAAIDHAYQLSDIEENDGADIVVFDKTGHEVTIIHIETGWEATDITDTYTYYQRDKDGNWTHVEETALHDLLQ